MDRPELLDEPKKETTNPWFQWIAFLSLVAVLLYSLIFNLGLSAITWIILISFTIICIPNNRFHYWLVRKWSEFLDTAKGLAILGATILAIGVVIGLGWWFLSSVGNGLGSIGKYEGQTAKEWFYEYDEAEARYQRLYDCVEPLAYSDNYEDLKSIYYECL